MCYTSRTTLNCFLYNNIYINICIQYMSLSLFDFELLSKYFWLNFVLTLKKGAHPLSISTYTTKRLLILNIAFFLLSFHSILEWIGCLVSLTILSIKSISVFFSCISISNIENIFWKSGLFFFNFTNIVKNIIIKEKY